MRVIAGSRKGHRISAPRGVVTRPTGDRVREAAFSLVGPLEGADVLDLFAGSGAMGIEALSRGAKRCVFVERDRDACRVIERNLEKLGLTGAVVLARDAADVLREEASGTRRYDRDWKWTYKQAGASRAYAAKMRSELAVAIKR